DGAPMFWRSQEALASGAVHYVGDPVALVVAETLAQAKDAAEAVAVDYDPFRPVNPVKALEHPGACVWGECAGNISNIHVMGDERATNEAIANADQVVRRPYVVSRVYAQFLEPRGAIGAYDADSERYTLYCDVQSPHQIRDQLAKEVLRIPAERLVVIAYYIGGAFGAKAPAVEHRLGFWAAGEFGGPAKGPAQRPEANPAAEPGPANAPHG